MAAVMEAVQVTEAIAETAVIQMADPDRLSRSMIRAMGIIITTIHGAAAAHHQGVHRQEVHLPEVPHQAVHRQEALPPLRRM